MKKISIFLAFVLLLTMAPMTSFAAEADVTNTEAVRNALNFDGFKGSNTSQYVVTKPLNLPTELQSTEGTTHKVVWTSSDESVISADGKTINRKAMDQWVTLYAQVYHEDTENHPTVYVDAYYMLRVPAADNSVTYLLQEDFESQEADSALTTSNSSAATGIEGWYLNNVSAEATTTYSFVNDEKTRGNKAMKALVTNTSGAYAFATKETDGTVPQNGLVYYGADYLCKGSSTSTILFHFWYERTYDTIKYNEIKDGATKVSVTTTSYTMPADTWVRLETIFDFDKGTATLYINGNEIYTTNTTQVSDGKNFNLFQFRLAKNSGDYSYFDNIEVKTLLAKEKEDFAKFNPATKGNIYVDGNLPAEVEANGRSYAVTYETSDPGVITASGVVTRPDFFTTVTVTPQISVGGFKLVGNTYKLNVLPKNGHLKMFENFDSITGIQEGSLFKEDGSEKYTGWTQSDTASYGGYAAEVARGNVANIVKENDNFALNMAFKTKSGYSGNKRVELLHGAESNQSSNNRIAISFRAKNLSDNIMAFASPYFGTTYNDNWYGCYGHGAGSPVTADVFKTKNKWQNFLFVYNPTNMLIPDNSKERKTVTLYVDGEYVGTSASDGWLVPAAYNQFILTQMPAYCGSSADYLVDDILMMDFDAETVQFGAPTVTGDILSSVKMQYNTYDTVAVNGTILVAKYDQNKTLMEVDKVENVPAISTVGYTEVTLNCDLAGAASYRLFLLNDMDKIQPLAISKHYSIQ